jgi:MFS family permease
MAFTGLIYWEPRRDEPLIDLRFFRSAPFSGATVIAVCAFAALGGFLFLNTLYLQDVRGYSALHAGMFMLPMAAMIVVCAPLSGRILAARGPRLPLVVAGLAIMASGAMLTRLATGTPASWLITCYLALGVGTGMVNPAITNTAVSSMPPSQAGVAAAIASTSRQVGTALGVAVMGSAVLSALHGPLRLGFAGASHVGWWIIAGCGAAVLLLAIITTGRWAKATAERAASRTAPGSPKVPVSS